MLKKEMLLVVLLGLGALTAAESHRNLQAVNGVGTGTHPDLQTTRPVTIEGIVLNRPLYLSNCQPNESAPGGPGAWWQVFIQGDPNDPAGTAVWLGQVYDNLPFGSGTYSDVEWLAELNRVNRDPVTGYAFAPGDRVRVTGLLKFHFGKTNITERHNADPAFDFRIELIEPAAGLPQPEAVTLDQLKDEQDKFIFDSNRLAGCEYYQGRLIRINGVSWVAGQDPNHWGPDQELLITDGVKTFPVKLGVGRGLAPGTCNLAETFDVIGILDQEHVTFTGPWTGGYRLWVPNYDGNGLVLTDRRSPLANLPGDIDLDGAVDLADLAALAIDWLRCAPGTGGGL